jgi:hypothetical protein
LFSKSPHNGAPSKCKIGFVYQIKYMSVIPYFSVSNGLVYGTSAVARLPWSLIKDKGQKAKEKAQKNLDRLANSSIVKFFSSNRDTTDLSQENPPDANLEKENTALKGSEKQSTEQVLPKTPSDFNFEEKYIGIGAKTEFNLGTLLKKPVNKFRAACWYEGPNHGLSLDL